MSTKTSIKRVALVAVSALGFGLLSVVPAKAAALTATDVAASAAAGAQTVGVAASIATLTIASNTSGAGNDTIAAVVDGPAGAVMTVTEAGGGDITNDNITVASSGTVTDTIDDAGASFVDGEGKTIVASFSMPGVYTINFAGDSDAVTVRVLPSTSATSSLSAAAGAAIYTTGTNAVINVARNSLGALTDGTILLRVNTTPDDSITVGEILGETEEAAVTAAAFNTTGRAFTFPGATFTVAGTYEFTAFVDANSNNAFDSSEVSTTASFTIGAAAAASTVISASLSRTIGSSSAGLNSVTVTATILDADLNPTTCDARVAETTSTGAAVTANSNNGYTTASNAIGASGSVLARVGTTNTYTGTFTINAAYSADDYFDTYLTVYCHSAVAADTTTSAKKALRIANDQNEVLTTVSGAKALVLEQSTTDTPVGSVTSGVRQTLSGTTSADIGAAATPILVDKTYVTHTYTISGKTGSEGEYVRVVVAPTATTSNAVVANSATLVSIGADLKATFSVTAVSPVAGDGYTVTVADDDSSSVADVVAYVDFATATPQWSTSPSASYTEKIGNSVSIKGILTDIFGRVLSSKAVTWTVAGRNVNQGSLTTDASGAATLTYTDTSTSTTALKDTVTFGYAYQASSTSTTLTTKSSTGIVVTFSSTGIAVGSVTVGAPSSQTTRAIDQKMGAAGAAAESRVSYTATVKKADGTPVGSGALVTFTGGADDLFYGGVNSGVTNEFGQVTVSVYRQKVGSPTITATAGGVTSAEAAAVKFTNDLVETASPNTAVTSTADYNARYITLTADQAKVASEGILRFTAKVTDRFGNAVAGVEVTFSETGAGRFMSGQTNPASTNSLGEVSIDLNSSAGETGTASVTALITDANSRMINDLAGVMSYTVNTTTVQAAVATVVSGLTAAVKSATATATIEKSTAVSTADALLELAKAIGTGKEVEAAADAAAEAIDAANAATDAANLAAEAADAATVAAEEARDAADAATAAVEELSTQVATLMAALKAQLTTLANTVAKIAKKVKA